MVRRAFMLDELDRELEQRKHCFVQYADHCNIYVRSRRAGARDAFSAGATGSMDTAQAAIHPLEATETRQVAVPKAMRAGGE